MPVFGALREDTLHFLLDQAREVFLDADQFFFREGDRAESMYVLEVGKVAEGRKKSYEEADALAQGRVWTGAEAARHGLVDRLGGRIWMERNEGPGVTVKFALPMA